jgi:signal transduction histidine kinase
LRSLIRMRLKKSGFEVIEAGDGQAAVNCFKRVAPDIVLMDANMPGMDGFEATRELKGTLEGKHTPILMVSGLEDDASVDKAFGAGATEYITKPICWPLLMHRLENICSALQAEANLLQAKLAADDANRSKTEFLANMSHELRTPMHAILSFASMGSEKVGKAAEEKLARYFSRIEESGKRLLLMLNDLLDLSKLEAGKMTFLMEQSDLLQTVDQVVGEFDALAKKNGITVDVESDNVVTTAWFDADRILQVVTNLISNAVKFSSPESVVKILFNDDSLVLDNGDQVKALRMTVRDEGIGIPENELESVFDKFVQSSETNTGAGGTGLGLAICKQIVEHHKGKIFAENNQEAGTSFHLILPRINVVD